MPRFRSRTRARRLPAPRTQRPVPGTTLSVWLVLAMLFVVAPAHADGSDPLIAVNRKIFWFNDKFDVYFLEPLARGWDFVMPDRAIQCAGNFFDNLRFPTNFVNNVLQGKPMDACKDVGRFAVNTTAGIAGLFDPAAGWGLEPHEEDFGQTLGVWGVPPGPYLVLPFWGASNLRDTAALPVDWITAVYPWFVNSVYTLSVRAVYIVNTRAQFLEEVEDLKEASVDYYTAVRDGYVRMREAQVKDSTDVSREEEDDLYYPDDEE